LGETETLRVLPSPTDSRKKTVEILSLALQVATTIADTSGKARALVEIPRKYIEVGQYDRALQIAGLIARLGEKRRREPPVAMAK